MKPRNIFFILLTHILCFTFVSCDEDGEIAMIKDSVQPNVLNALSPSTVTLLPEEANNNFQPIGWSATDFGYKASVTYTLQVAIQGFDFAGAINLGSTSDESIVLTNNQINNALLGLGLEPGEETPVEFRTISSIGASIASVNSNAVSATITPFAPASNPTLFIIGDAQGWDLANALQLEYVGPGKYEGVGQFVNPGTFRFFETPSWDASQMGAGDFSSLPPELNAAGDGDDNFRFVGTTGVFKISVSVNDGVITMESTAVPDLFIIGGDQGWNLGNAFSLTWLGGSRFEGTTTFSNNEIFRFFEVPDWGAQQYNYLYFEVVDEDFENDGGGDNNFRLLESTGTYTIHVDLLNKTVTLE